RGDLARDRFLAARVRSLPADKARKVKDAQDVIEAPDRAVPLQPAAPAGHVAQLVAMLPRERQRELVLGELRRDWLVLDRPTIAAVHSLVVGELMLGVGVVAHAALRTLRSRASTSSRAATTRVRRSGEYAINSTSGPSAAESSIPSAIRRDSVSR